jgi:HEAT repeat protein
MNLKQVSWNNIENLDDELITYLLYKEGKSIEAISLIRNISREKVEKDIIDAKIKLRTLKTTKKDQKKTLLDKMLELPKKKRLEFIKNGQPKVLQELYNEIKQRYRYIDNPDDRATVIWIIGELKNSSSISLLSKDVIHYNGNVRRMVCSALGKIGDSRAKPVLHKALQDEKPQVRQYAAKALRDIGDKDTIRLLLKVVNNKSEKDYVKNTCLETIQTIKQNLNLT